MIYVNANLDLKSFRKIKMQELNDLLGNLCKETLYVTFIARKERFETRAFQDEGDSFLKVVVPYDKVLSNENNLPLLLTHLIQNLKLLTWLDHSLLKKRIESLLRKNSEKDIQN